MKLRELLVGLIAGLLIGVASASTVDKLHITKDGVITYLNQACTD